jgi:DNA-binding transcriptional MerR regulator
MLRIGEFSRLARVSVKALRLYDRLGLLKPAQTDEFTGYRYYSSGQLPRLNAILALKELGFSLEQVALLLDEGSPLERARAMLELRRDEARRALEAERDRLARIEARLRQMDREGAVPTHEVVLKAVGARRVAAVREVLPTYGDIGVLFGELRGYAERHGVRAGDWISVWHDEEFREENVDGEAAFTTDDPLPEDGRVRQAELSALGSMACTVHQGPFSTIGGAYAALLAWI